MDELREQIKAIIIEAREEDHRGGLIMYSDEAVDRILALPTLKAMIEDAEKWRKVKEIAKRHWLDGYPCEGCPVEAQCGSSDSLCGQMNDVVEALEAPDEQG